jgi:hypothetical protein
MQGYLFGPGYRFAVGEGVVLAARNTFFQVQWRGYLRVSGQRRRVHLYWLGEPFWDCCYGTSSCPSVRCRSRATKEPSNLTRQIQF